MLKSILLALSIAVTSSAYAASDISAIYPTVVQVANQDENICSGVSINPSEISKDAIGTYVVTAKHCINDDANGMYKVIVRNYNKESISNSETVYKARVLKYSYDYDLAILRVLDSSVNIPYSDLIPENHAAYAGDDVVTIGYPLGEDLTITKGVLEPKSYLKLGNYGINLYWRASPAIINGNSGGGLFTEVDGKYYLLGITSAVKVKDTQVVTFMGVYVPVDQLREFLAIK